jgi:hypothetical protein
MEGRRMTHLDEQEIYREAREQSKRVNERSGLLADIPVFTKAYD